MFMRMVLSLIFRKRNMILFCMGRRLFILFTWITFHLPVTCPSQSDMGCRITLQNVKREFNMAFSGTLGYWQWEL